MTLFFFVQKIGELLILKWFEFRQLIWAYTNNNNNNNKPNKDKIQISDR